ncbi:glycosyltransferase involved in cell wall biosynthesis [Sporomusaceae bacterium BoRhaA]|uniref:glycosyltransferase family 4 protein n=1 Tax=Pelorhabdus rhamnosifermentans TaxID=2772457 RepID=UPI001C05FEC0|nr:glycosyltransferase family 1 protein [Pelorhabdus rhamnosifermentans]MBU2699026.1 glycosyltransferase involved in cell wall biosynthesis [Pelorhabdus rhamnosifermentans]
MKIFLDGVSLINKDLGGVGYYCYNLIKHLQQVDRENNYTVIYNKSKLKTLGLIKAPEKKVSYPYRNILRILGPHFLYHVPLECFTGNFDIYHGTGYVFLPTRKAKKVITVHDLVSKHFPEILTPSNLYFQEKQVPYYANKADRIIAVSQSTKNDLVNFLQINPNKIDVTYLAADKIYQPLDMEDPNFTVIRKKYSLPEKFILHIGTLNERKNIPTTLQSFYRLCIKGCEHDLVLVGGKGNAYDDVMAMITKLRLENRVKYIGYTDIADLPYLYNLADLFLHVSKLEGFGLPVLEAMQCGTPVLVSNGSSLPEIVQEAGIMANPLDVDDIEKKMEIILQDEQLRRELSLKGIRQAEKFSWEKMARETIETYQKTLAV